MTDPAPKKTNRAVAQNSAKNARRLGFEKGDDMVRDPGLWLQVYESVWVPQRWDLFSAASSRRKEVYELNYELQTATEMHASYPLRYNPDGTSPTYILSTFSSCVFFALKSGEHIIAGSVWAACAM